ncbi:MAG TPA: S41 family peptidase [Vicinamibacterales bacterium]|nr:S41 family peptidase [Vicinamibacterales bacterium]
MSRYLVTFLLALVVTGSTPSAALAQAGPASCSITGKNLYVRDVMSDLYFWYREMPELNPASFDSPEAYLEAVRFRPLDTTFSYITSRAANDAFFSESQFIGFGLSTSLDGVEMRVMQVFPDSPASEAGLSRGERIVEIGGRTVASMVETGEIGGAFGPTEIGVETDVVLTNPAGSSRSVHMTKRLVTIPTVSLTRVYTVQGRRVGYVFFRNFVQPSFEALDNAFAELAAERVDELVLDLRYNGGGLVNVAQHLASYIGGQRTEGLVFAEYFHNDRNTFRNRILRFDSKPAQLRLERLIVVTTRGSASASELVINALRPFMPVVVIGGTTYGKPVGQYGIPFCDLLLAPVSFALRNADGQGDFFDGFAPDCPAPDDADHQLGDPQEGSLKEALTFAATGACSAPAAAALRTARAQRRGPRVLGWQSLVNAY